MEQKKHPTQLQLQFIFNTQLKTKVLQRNKAVSRAILNYINNLKNLNEKHFNHTRMPCNILRKLYVQKPLHKSIVSYNGYINNDYYLYSFTQ